MRPAGKLLAAVLLILSAGCARTDLGAPCHLQDASGAELHPRPGREYLYLGSSECESFSCLATPGATSGYCSQPCAGTSASCPSGMTCSALALDSSYLGYMRATLAKARYQTLFGQLTGSYYCVRSGN